MSIDKTEFVVPERSVSRVRQELIRHPLLAMEVPNGHALSYPVPRRSELGVLLAHFAYSAPALPSGMAQSLSRPRYWLLTPTRELRVLLFADCRVHDFMPNGYADAGWVRPELPVTSLVELRQLEQQLLIALDAFVDEAFSPRASLPEDTCQAITTYSDLIQQLTPEPLTPFLQGISPEFWDWVSDVRDADK